MIDFTHNPERTSWVESANSHPDFPIQNLPLAVFSPSAGEPRIGCAIGDRILDLAALSIAGLAPEALGPALRAPRLNALFATPPGARRILRRRLSRLLRERGHQAAVEPHLHAAKDCTFHLPADIGDYTDFYVGIHHATNVGRLFRPDQPLMPNYKHVPIGYHGRASSVQVSGAPVRRPSGQILSAGAAAPSFGPTQKLDFELELGVWIGPGNPLGRPIPIATAQDHIAGVCLLNDWSARDMQAWEYQPLGPFLSKSFQTTVSPWVVTAEALAPYRVPPKPRPAGDPEPLDYLRDEGDARLGALAVAMDVHLTTAKMRSRGASPVRLSSARTSDMYWTMAQIVTHHASAGCNLRPGDLLGTGTLSGPQRHQAGSLLELTLGGAEPITLPSGETRTFLLDGDEIILTARAEAPDRRSIGFGQCRAIVGAA